MGKRHEQTFYQRGHTMANYAHEKVFNILAIREMQTETPTIRMAKKTGGNTKCWQGCREAGSLIYCW